jgi:hypothetical protein
LDEYTEKLGGLLDTVFTKLDEFKTKAFGFTQENDDLFNFFEKGWRRGTRCKAQQRQRTTNRKIIASLVCGTVSLYFYVHKIIT